MAKEFLYGKTLGELQAVCAELQLPRFVAKQIADWLYRKEVHTIDEMTNLSKVARASLGERFELGLRAPEGEQTSSDGTKKYLYRTAIIVTKLYENIVSGNHFAKHLVKSSLS